jgi:hypothetical protein
VEGIRLEPRLLVGCRFGFELLDGRPQRRLLVGRSPDEQAFGRHVVDDLHLGIKGLQHLHQTGRIGRPDRVRGQFPLSLRRNGLLELLKRRFDRSLVGRRGDHHQPLVFRVDGELGLRSHFGEQLEHFGRRFLIERIESQLGGLGVGGCGSQLFQGRFDSLVIGWCGHGDQSLLRGVRRELGVGDQLLQQRQGRGRIDSTQSVDFHHAGVICRLVQSQLFQGRFNQLLL